MLDANRTLLENGWGQGRHQLLKNFRRVNHSTDIVPLVQEADVIQDVWLANRIRQERIAVQRETNSICLRGADTVRNPRQDVRDVLDCFNTIHANRFPLTMVWLWEFAAIQNQTLRRVQLVRLKPFGRVYPHVDVGEYYRACDRYHLVLSSPAGSELTCGNESVIMHEGELWWFDNTIVHEANNKSEQWRVHVIFDLL